MQTALEQVFQQSSSVTWLLQLYAVAIFHDDSRFYVFDSHNRDSNGFACPDVVGHSVLMYTDTIFILTLFLRQLCMSLRLMAGNFEATPVTIKSVKTSEQSAPTSARKHKTPHT